MKAKHKRTGKIMMHKKLSKEKINLRTIILHQQQSNRSHSETSTFHKKFEEVAEMNTLLYIDVGATIFETRNDLQKATNIMKQNGLTIHIGQ